MKELTSIVLVYNEDDREWAIKSPLSKVLVRYEDYMGFTGCNRMRAKVTRK